MRWWQFALLGAGGGALVEVLSLFKWFTVWQGARRSVSGAVRHDPPRLQRYVDIPAHSWMLVLRATLGAVSAAIFAAGGQLKGAYVAVALGFCGPALLERLGELPQISSMIVSDAQVADTSTSENGSPQHPGEDLLPACESATDTDTPAEAVSER